MADVCSLLTPAEMSEKLKGVVTEDRLVELAEARMIPHYTIDDTIWFGASETREWVNHNLVVRHQGKHLGNALITAVDVVSVVASMSEVPVALKAICGSLIPMSIQSVETTGMSGVYFLCHKGEVVYVGQSGNVFQRVGQHIGVKSFDSVFFVRVPPSDLNFVEGELIRLLSPKYNHNKRGVVVGPTAYGQPQHDESAQVVSALRSEEATDGQNP